MSRLFDLGGRQRSYLLTVAFAVAFAAILTVITLQGPLPIVGAMPILPVTLAYALMGIVALAVLEKFHRPPPPRRNSRPIVWRSCPSLGVRCHCRPS